MCNTEKMGDWITGGPLYVCLIVLWLLFATFLGWCTGIVYGNSVWFWPILFSVVILILVLGHFFIQPALQYVRDNHEYRRIGGTFMQRLQSLSPSHTANQVTATVTENGHVIGQQPLVITHQNPDTQAVNHAANYVQNDDVPISTSLIDGVLTVRRGGQGEQVYHLHDLDVPNPDTLAINYVGNSVRLVNNQGHVVLEC
jgi:hypothetical protein